MANSSCREFMDDVIQNYKEDIAYEDLTVNYGFPFFISSEWNENELYQDKDTKIQTRGVWNIKRNSKNNILVSSPKPPLTNPRYFSGDEIIEINDESVSDISDEKLIEIFSSDYSEKDVGKKLKLKISRKGDVFTFEEEIKKYEFYYNLLSLNISDIEIDIQKNKFTSSIEMSLSADFSELKKFTDKHFVEDGVSYGCSFSDDEINVMQLPRVDEYFEIINGKVINRVNLVRNHEIDSNIETNTGMITANLKKDLEVNNRYQLKAFPFDRQILIYKFVGITYEQYLDIDNLSEQRISHFLKNTSIPGWKITDYSFVNGLYQGPTFATDQYVSEMNIKIEIQRSYEFYIFKIIIPILLILMICWSVLWIAPTELESRLTITIVCLLSLIAYNFVIGEDLPKLSYLTVMDYLILLSYFYAAVPNFISIASFRLCKTNSELCDRIENTGKKFGPLSYVLLVILIVIFSINNNPYTAEFLAGLI